MRVLLVTNTFPPAYTGGAEVSNYHTCQALIRRGVQCSVLFINNRMPQPLDQWYDFHGLPVHRVNFHTWRRTALNDVFDWRIYRAMKRELDRIRPDIVHMTNMSGATLAPYVACRRVGVPVVNMLHDLWLLCPNNMLYRADGSFCNAAEGHGRCRQCFRRYDFWGDIPYRRSVFAALTSNVRLFIAPSRAVIDRHVEAGYRADRFRHVPHGLAEPEAASSVSPAIRKALAIGQQYHTLTFAGGGLEIKGAGVLLEALPEMLRHIPQLRVLIAGVGEERFLARFRDFAPRVEVLGWMPFRETPRLYGAAELVTVPSTCHEAFSLVTVESMQAGTPVVGSDFGGIAELIRDGEDGYLFPVGEATALTQKVIAHFARPPVERRRMRQACVQAVRTRFTLENHINGILNVYREALS